MRSWLAFSLAVSGCSSALAAAAAPAPPSALGRFAADYQSDPAIAKPFEFGVRIDEQWWTVSGAPNQPVTVKAGKPTSTTFSFEMGSDTLGKLDSGALNPLTASGKHSSSAQAPLEVEGLNGYKDNAPENVAEMRRTLFSFWTRGQPERVPIALEKSRLIHDAPAVLLYYASGFRSVWHTIRAGERINNHHGRGKGQPWEYLIVVTKAGGGKAKIGDKEIKLVDKEAVFVPARAPLDLSTDAGEPLEIILLMFGEKA